MKRQRLWAAWRAGGQWREVPSAVQTTWFGREDGFEVRTLSRPSFAMQETLETGRRWLEVKMRIGGSGRVDCREEQSDVGCFCLSSA